MVSLIRCFLQYFQRLCKKSTIALQLNDQFQYFKLEQKTSDSKIVWNTHQIPAVELPPHKKQNELNFQLFKDNHYIGRARSFIQFGRNKKDCLDIVNKNFEIVGKLLYEARWLPKSYQQKMITLQQYYRLGKGTANPNPYTTQGIQRAKQVEQRLKNSRSLTRRQREIFQHNQFSQQEDVINCFSCFSMKRSISALDQVEMKKLRNYPILYKQSQLQLVKDQNLFPETVQKPMYYSKRFFRTKPIEL